MTPQYCRIEQKSEQMSELRPFTHNETSELLSALRPPALNILLLYT